MSTDRFLPLFPGDPGFPDPSAHESVQDEGAQVTLAPYIPDHSTHHQPTRLQDQGARAALNAARSQPHADERRNWPLDANGKLSSASAATSLKYAKPTDLPSFPSVGLDTRGSANSSASVAGNSQISSEHHKQDLSAAAGKAALLANEYKMAPLWHPSASAAGSKAATLAAKEGAHLDLWMPEASKEGNSAANIAMRTKGLSPQLDYGYTPDGKKRALLAATLSVSHTKNHRGTQPDYKSELYPDQANAGYNALNAATAASYADGLNSPAIQASRIQNIGKNVPREMFTEHPPVSIEVEEKKHQEALHASAVTMAKQMFNIQQKRFEEVVGELGHGANAAQGQQTMQFGGLQQAAKKLADERLAKIEKSMENERYREHYGYGSEPPRSMLSLRGRGKQRTSNTEEADSDDEWQARRIRHKTTALTTGLAKIDDKKRQNDRVNLLAAAERRVHERLHAMDERIYAETGKVSPALMEEWEKKANAKAAAESETRMQNHGKVHIGGGKFMDQSEIDAIARRRLQPTLDEISNTAEKQRARDEEVKRELEEKKRQAAEQKRKEAEEKAERKRIRNEEKQAERARRMEEKQAARQQKGVERAQVAEGKQQEERTSVDVKQPVSVKGVTDGVAATPEREVREEPREGVVAPVVAVAVERVATTSSAERGLSSAGTEATLSSLSEDANSVVRRVLQAPVVAGPDHVSIHDHPDEAHLISTTIDPLPEVKPYIDTAIPEGHTTAVIISTEPRISTTGATAATTSVEPRTSTAASKTSAEMPSSSITAAAGAGTAGTTSITARDTTSPPKERRESKLKGFLTKFRGKRDGRIDAAPTASGVIPAPVQNDHGHHEKAGTPAAGGPSSFSGGKTASGAEVRAERDISPTAAVGTSTAQTKQPGLHNEAVPVTGTSTVAGMAKGKRRESISSVSSLSSTGDEADYVLRGRQGRKGVGVPDDEDEEEEEAFEEARDTFDEGLAPPPTAKTFGAREKGESPVRETRFSEDL